MAIGQHWVPLVLKQAKVDPATGHRFLHLVAVRPCLIGEHDGIARSWEMAPGIHAAGPVGQKSGPVPTLLIVDVNVEPVPALALGYKVYVEGEPVYDLASLVKKAFPVPPRD